MFLIYRMLHDYTKLINDEYYIKFLKNIAIRYRRAEDSNKPLRKKAKSFHKEDMIFVQEGKIL